MEHAAIAAQLITPEDIGRWADPRARTDAILVAQVHATLALNDTLLKISKQLFGLGDVIR